MFERDGVLKWITRWSTMVTMLLLVACTTDSPVTPATGADRDAHGCIPSAGYRWCVLTEQCERPWELADRVEIENSAEAFDAYCGNPLE